MITRDDLFTLIQVYRKLPKCDEKKDLHTLLLKLGVNEQALS